MLNLGTLCRKAPKGADIEELRAKIAKLRGCLPKDSKTVEGYEGARLQAIDQEADDLKKRLEPLESDGKIDPAKWDAQPEADRRQLGDRLSRLFTDLRCLMRRERIVGRTYFITFAALLVVLVTVYVLAHWKHWKAVTQPATSVATEQKPPAGGTAAQPSPLAAGSPTKPSQSSTSVPPEKIVAVVRELKRVELAAAAQRAAKPAKPPGTKDEQDALKKAIEATRNRVTDLKTAIDNLDLSFTTLQLFGSVDAEAQNETLADNSESLTKLRPALLADLDSLRAGFFWNDRVWRWIELAWWAEFGVLIGILFYVAGTMSEGRFETENISMFWTEIFIAPVVVAVIFFLFTLTGITGISPSETALPGNVGFAFIFGFAIRRTLGLLDNIKKRIFPEPSP